MRLVPQPNHLRWLSKEDQAYWRGYFEGIASAKIQIGRRHTTINIDAHIKDALTGMDIYQRFYLSKGFRAHDKAAIAKGLKGLTKDRKHRLLGDLKNILRLMQSGHAYIHGGATYRGAK